MNVKKVMKEELGEMRISKQAVGVLNEAVKRFIKGVTAESVVMAKHAGRKTVKENDMKLAAE